MRAKAKSSSTPYPIWVEGEYITEPPIRPSDGAVRPAGHYIDKGGYPGANVYEVDINTMCRQTDAADRFGKPIYEQDILLYETAEEIGYFIVQDLSSKAHSDPASVSKGDIVTFTGGGVYKSSTAEYASVQKNVTSTCKVTAVNTKGTHPYHCISQDGKGVYGWVNAADVK